MENKIENLDQLETVLLNTSLKVNKLVFAKEGNEAFSQVTINNSKEFTAALVEEMRESANFANLITDAAKQFEHSPFKGRHDRSATLLDLEKCFQNLPQNTRAFCVIDIDGGILMFLNGNPIHIAATLCGAQEREPKIFDILQLAAEGFNHGLAMGVVKSPENFKKG